MTRNEIIKELENYKYDYLYFKEKFSEIEKLKVMLQKTYNRQEELKLKNLDNSVLINLIKEILDKQHKEESILLNLVANKQVIEKRIEKLTQPYRNIIYFKYINLNTIDEIALKMNYSSKRIYQLHKTAVESYCNLVEKELNKNTELITSL